MTFADLFSGIGGFRLGLEAAGMQCAWACEIDDFCRKVYLKHWPDTEPFYDDIRTITNPPTVDLVCGGFPCQPFSVAGKRQGADDTRNLWPEMLRVIDLVRPSWVLGENVPGIGDYLDTVVSDLEARGFEVVPFEIEAAAVGAHHRRARVWIVAHASTTGAGVEKHRSNRQGREQPGTPQSAVLRQKHRPTGSEGVDPGSADVAHAKEGGRRRIKLQSGNWQELGIGGGSEDVADASGTGLPQSTCPGIGSVHSQVGSSTGGQSCRGNAEMWGSWLPESRLGRGFDGIPSWLDGSWEHGVPRVATGVKDRVNRLKSLGNAVVPQVVEWIGRRIMEADAGMVR